MIRNRLFVELYHALSKFNKLSVDVKNHTSQLGLTKNWSCQTVFSTTFTTLPTKSKQFTRVFTEFNFTGGSQRPKDLFGKITGITSISKPHFRTYRLSI